MNPLPFYSGRPNAAGGNALVGSSGAAGNADRPFEPESQARQT